MFIEIQYIPRYLYPSHSSLGIIYYKRSTSRVFFVYCVALSLWVLNQYFSKKDFLGNTSYYYTLERQRFDFNDKCVVFFFVGTHQRDLKK